MRCASLLLLPVALLLGPRRAQCGAPDAAQMEEMMAKMDPETRAKMKGMMGGGPGGRGGGKPGKAPKQISTKKAMTLVKELKGAISTKKATEAIEKAAAGSSKGDSAEAAAKSRMAAIQPEIQRLTKNVCAKYGFTGGFQEAMQSLAGAVQKKTTPKHQKIRTGIEAIGEILSGHKNPNKAGRVPALDQLAGKFLEMDKAGMQDAIADAQKVVDGLTLEDGNLTVPGADAYLYAMRGVLEYGPQYVENTLVEMLPEINKDIQPMLKENADLIDGPKAKPEPKVSGLSEEGKQLMIRANILLAFLTEADRARIKSKLSEATLKMAVAMSSGSSDLLPLSALSGEL